MIQKRIKYPQLEEPCKSCLYKCGRVEELTFIKDENCKYKQNYREEINEFLGIQEKIDL